ncbi:hypothetical protein F5Y18DRAFT_424407 [Xylariaceae sp. FL1019]|nr:hypothetical protein F5Y18DRAFT_424407 [Xylariaceae sp. FL1019]
MPPPGTIPGADIALVNTVSETTPLPDTMLPADNVTPTDSPSDCTPSDTMPPDSIPADIMHPKKTDADAPHPVALTESSPAEQGLMIPKDISSPQRQRHGGNTMDPNPTHASMTEATQKLRAGGKRKLFRQTLNKSRKKRPKTDNSAAEETSYPDDGNATNEHSVTVDELHLSPSDASNVKAVESPEDAEVTNDDSVTVDESNHCPSDASNVKAVESPEDAKVTDDDAQVTNDDSVTVDKPDQSTNDASTVEAVESPKDTKATDTDSVTIDEPNQSTNDESAVKAVNSPDDSSDRLLNDPLSQRDTGNAEDITSTNGTDDGHPKIPVSQPGNESVKDPKSRDDGNAPAKAHRTDEDDRQIDTPSSGHTEVSDDAAAPASTEAEVTVILEKYRCVQCTAMVTEDDIVTKDCRYHPGQSLSTLIWTRVHRADEVEEHWEYVWSCCRRRGHDAATCSVGLHKIVGAGSLEWDESRHVWSDSAP